MLVRIALALALVLGLAQSPRAQLIELPDARYITRCPGPAGDLEKDLPVANTSFCDRSPAFNWTFGDPPMASSATGEAIVSAEAFSTRPAIPAGMPDELIPLYFPILSEPFIVAAVVEAVAQYTLTGPLLPPPPGMGLSQIDGMAAVEASFRVRQTGTPPLLLDDVPLRLRVRALMRVQGVGNTSATVRVTVNGDPEDSFEFTTPISNGVFDIDEEFPDQRFEIEQEQSFIKLASCSAEALFPGGNSQCYVFLDPIIRFDQEALDQQLGPQSFPLEDFFALEFSENLTIDAPGNICGDVDVDDIVAADDLDLLRRALAGETALDAAGLDRCQTHPASSGCDLSDAVVLARVVGQPVAQAPGIAPACAEVVAGSS